MTNAPMASAGAEARLTSWMLATSIITMFYSTGVAFHVRSLITRCREIKANWIGSCRSLRLSFVKESSNRECRTKRGLHLIAFEQIQH